MWDALRWLWDASRWLTPAAGVVLVLYALFAPAASETTQHRNRGAFCYGLFALLTSSRLMEALGVQSGSAIDVILVFTGLAAFFLGIRYFMRAGRSTA
jgi:hypothetical protein